MEEQFETCYAEIFHGWEQKVNNNGVIYYVNNELQKTTWNHPYLDKVLKDLGFLFADINYAAYRTALKLRLLQLQFGLHWITISGLKETVFVESEGDGVETQPLTYEQALLLIERILESSGQHDMHRENVSKSADLILNFMANLYDRGHSGKLVPRCIQNALLVLCGSKLSDKYKFLCSRLQDKTSGNIAREGLIHLIDDLIQIPCLLKEARAFGIDVIASVDSCFRQNQSAAADTVSQGVFLKWLCLEPQTLLWLPTLHRVIATEKVQHAVSCSMCSDHPITGFRYRCLVCFGYNLCQKCFFQGHVSLSHRLTHRVKEYCFPATSTDTAKCWVEIVRNKLLRRHRRKAKMAYLPVESSETQEAVLHWEPTSVQVDQATSLSHCGDDAFAQPDQHLTTGAINLEVEPESIHKKSTKLQVLMGQPFHTSSPIIGGIIQGQTFPCERNDENQHKMMAKKILELQQENRILKKKLYSHQQTESVEASEHLQESSAVESLKITVGSPISPIIEHPKSMKPEMTVGEVACDMEKSKQGQNTLAIIGAFTPVRGGDYPAINVDPSTPLTDGGNPGHQDYTDFTMPNCLQYRSSDMSLLSSDSKVCQNVTPNSSKASSACTSLKKSNQFVDNYKPSDMSILCLGLAKNTPATDADEVRGNLDLKTSTFSSHRDEETVSSLDSVSVSNTQKDKCRKKNYINSVTQLTHEYQHCSPQPCAMENTSRGLLSPESGTGSDIELSNIDPENLTSTYFTHNPNALLSLAPTPEQFVTDARRKTIEPVHMSTPVATFTNAICTKSLETKGLTRVGKKKQCSFIKKELDLSENKENITESTEPFTDQSIIHSCTGRAKLQTEVFSSSKYLCELNTRVKKTNEVYCKSITSVNKKTDHKRDSKTMLSQDRDELNKIMADFERECKISDFTQSDGTKVMTTDDSSVLAAALNIGDALEEFVQAVAHSDPDQNISDTTEMTQF